MPKSAEILLQCLIIALVTLILFWTGAPWDYQFSWPDAPRHALNGAFILDFVRAFPWHDPVEFAYNYYAQYPALTILLYPPLYPTLLAVSYALFGVSQVSALLVNAALYVFMGCGMLLLARRYLGAWAALASALLLLVAPEIAFWGRQTMTDVPAMALMVWAALCFVTYLQTRRLSALYWTGLFAVLAIWIKITVCFIVPAFALTLLLVERGTAFKRGHYWMVAALITVGVLPIIWLTLHFGQTNIHSVEGVKDAAVSRYGLANWIWYARQVPGQLGWPVTVVATCGLIAALAAAVRRRRMTADRVFMLTWLLVGYLFFSAIDLKAARFSIVILPPLLLVSVWLIVHTLCGHRYIRDGAFAMLVLSTAVVTVWTRPVLYVDGYRQVVQDVTRRAPKNSNIVFSGYRDGSFIFAMRAIGHRPDLDTVRADKLLLRVNIRRTLGVKQKNKSKKAIARELTRLKGSYVVAQPNFWTDLAIMRRLTDVLNGPQFRAVASYRMPANYPAQEKTLVIYKNLSKSPNKRPNLSIDLPAIDRTISQTH